MEEEDLLTYDNDFNLYDSLLESKPTKRKLSTPSTEVARNTSFGKSKFDTDFFPNIEINWDKSGENLESLISENRAQRQPWAYKFGAGLTRVVTKAASEIAKMPGVLGGIGIGVGGQISDLFTGEDNTDFMKTAFDNAWINSVQDAEDAFKENVLPVYVKKAVSEGNLWDNITAIDFWATEGADGLGYIAAMLAPGALVNKLNIGSKLLGVDRLANMAKNNKKALDVLNSVGYNAKNANVFTATIANTIFEAGAEAKGAMDSYDAELEIRLNLPANDPNKLTQEQYNAQKQLSSKVGANVFAANAAILFGPNLIMSKILWGGPRNKTPNKILSNNSKFESQNLTTKTKLGNAVKDFGKAGAREGFFEEGMQSTAENYFTENPNKSIVDFIAGDFAKAYVDTISTTEGQKAVFLGLAFGGGMQAFTGYKQASKENKVYNELATQGNETLDKFYSLIEDDIYKKDDEGKVVYTQNKEGTLTPELDPLKIKDKLVSFMNIEDLSTAYDYALLQGDIETVKDIQDIFITKLIKPFVVNESLGTDVLKKHLEESIKLQNIPQELIDNKSDFIKNVLDKAEFLKKEYNLINSFSESIFDLSNTNLPNEHKVRFINAVNDSYLNLKAREHFNNTKLDKFNKQLENLIESKGIDKAIYEQNGALQIELNTTDKRFSIINDNIKAVNKVSEKINKDIKDFFSDNNVNKSIKRYERDYNKAEKAKEKEGEVNDVLEKIKNAKTQEELDNIKSPSEDINTIIGEAKSKRSNKLIQQESEEDTSIKNSNEEFNSQQEDTKDNNEKDEKSVVYNTEGNIDDQSLEVEIEDTSGNKYESASQPRIVITDNNKGAKKLSFISESALEFERNPVNKIGQVKNVEINTGETSNNTDVEAKKADIEKRRQKELKSWLPSDVIKINKQANQVKDVPENPSRVPSFFRKVIKPIIDSNRTIFNEMAGLLYYGIGSFKSNNETYKIVSNKTVFKEIIRESDNKVITTLSKGDFQGNEYEILNILKNIQPTISSETANRINAKYYEELKALKSNTTNNKPNSITSNPNWKKAIDMYNSNDFSDIEFLIDHLPINIKLTDNTSAPIETKPNDDTKVFNETSRELRKIIIKELALNKTDINNIQVKIAGQSNGELQLDGNNTNFVHELYDFDGKLESITSDKLYVVDDTRRLVNTTNNIFPTNRKLGRGEIYIKINTAAGNSFPLKLNISKLSENEADVLYDIYKYRFTNREEGKNTLLKNLNEDLQDKIKTVLSKEIELYSKNDKKYDTLTTKDIIDILIWDGTDSNKTKIKFNKESLVLGKVKINEETFNSEEGKSKFINFLTDTKRRNIKFKRNVAKGETSNSLNIDNKSYIDYLISNKVLSTNAKVNELTFSGKTTMYLSKDGVLVNGKLSEFNKDVPVIYKSNLIGTNSKLDTALPNMKVNPATLDKDGKYYEDEQGNKYSRVSTLKDKDLNLDKINVYNAAKRGDVTDELLRLFFTKNISETEFLKLGKSILNKVNTEKSKSVISIADSYYQDLYNILITYKKEFNNRNYTIYANSYTLKGTLGVHGENSGRYAGTMDLLAYDNANKEWIIIDLKTSTVDRNLYYNGSIKDTYEYVKKDLIQQNAYRELFKQTNDITPTKLLILPLISKADTMANDVYSDIKLSSANLFIEVDSTKDIYDIMNIKMTYSNNNKNAVSKLLQQTNNEVKQDEQVDEKSNLNLNKFMSFLPKDAKNAIGVPNKVPAKTVAVKKTAEPIVNSDIMNLTPEDNAKVIQEMSEYDTTEIKFNDKMYYVGKESKLIINFTDSKIVTSIKEARSVIEFYNKKPDTQKFDLNSLEKIWKSKIKVVTLQTPSEIIKENKSTSEIIDYSNMTEDTASNAIIALMDSNPSIIKKINQVISKGNNNVSKLKNLIDYLVDTGASKENIKTKCNL